MSGGVCKKINVLSDDEDEGEAGIRAVSPVLKKHRSGIDSVLIIDDESTPGKPFNRPSPILVIETPTSDVSRPDFSISNCGEPSEISSKHGQEHNSNAFRFDKWSGYPEQSPIFIPETPISEPQKCSTSANVFHSHNVSLSREELISDVSGFDKPSGDLEQSPIFIQETPILEPPRADASFVKCSTSADIYHSQNASSSRERVLSRITRMSSLDSINENERCTDSAADNVHPRSPYSSVQGNFQPDITKVKNRRSKKSKQKNEGVAGKVKCRKQMTEGERIIAMVDKQQKKEKDRMQKAALKAETEAMKKIEKEQKKWENGKFALKSILAEIDYKVVESGSVGGHLLTSFSEKGIKYRVTSNPIQQTVVWTMAVPKEISQISSEKIEIPYVVLVYMAEEFCNSVKNKSFMHHVSYVRSRYPCYTICVLTSNLMAYINKREQANYKNPGTFHGWTRPPVEEIFAKLTTDFFKVHSRQCMDEAEIAEHVVGLTCSLASCQFRKKPTRLSIYANGMVISKDCIDKNLIKKSLWLKALVAIPKVQPRFAVAIWKKYPTMKSLLLAYMDSTKSVHEKEFMLKDLLTEGLTGEDRRVGEICSKRVYRIIMSRNGNILTDDVEDGADLFSHPT